MMESGNRGRLLYSVYGLYLIFVIVCNFFSIVVLEYGDFGGIRFQ